MNIYKFILDLIAPKKCYSCNKEWHFLCEDCVKIELDFSLCCYKCKWLTKNWETHEECKKNVFYDKIIVLNHYREWKTSKLIKDAKFYNKKEIFLDFSNYMYEKFILNQKMVNKNDFLIVSIPSHFTRKIKRWYNSSEVISKYFSKISWIIYKKNILKKVKNTRQQSKLSRQERLKNLEKSFKISKNKLDIIKWKKIILIDDVISTGTTINEISKILKNNWVNYVIWLIIASD